MLTFVAVIVSVSAAICLSAAPDALSQSSYRLKTSVISAAGAAASAGSKRADGTLAQTSPPGFLTAAGSELYSGFWKSGLLSTITDSELPDAAHNKLSQNFPNPFNPTTTIRYSTARDGRVGLIVFNVKGQRVRTLVDETRPSGNYTAVWDGRNDGGRTVATGVYFYRLTAGSFTEVRKMVLLR
jgi:hypothetical protein